MGLFVLILVSWLVPIALVVYVLALFRSMATDMHRIAAAVERIARHENERA